MTMARLAFAVAMFFLGAWVAQATQLERKAVTEWGTTAPCVEAIEDITAEVNERLGNE
jgi:hypothetical protein